MNRQQRRAAGKATPVLRFDKAAAAVAQRAAIMGARTDPMTPEISTRLLLPAYAALENLTHGRADDDDFIRLVKFNLFGYELSARLWQYGNAKEQFAKLEPDFQGAADALELVGKRKEATGRYGTAAAELAAIRASLVLLAELLALSTEGHAITALTKADETIRAKLAGR